MRIAILSDIHSNLEALQAVFDTIERRGVEAIYCLGDIVGYGADAAACVDLVRARCTASVRGNHDEAVALERDVDRLPRDAREAAAHNRAQLSEAQRTYLAGLPLRLEVDGCTFVHATPDVPEAWKRIDSHVAARAQFDHFSTAVCFGGHTHIPAVLAHRLGVLQVRPGNRYFINVGSVGQPRDRIPHLCVAFFDTDRFSYDLVRVPYPVEEAAAKITAAGLPPSLAERLKKGF